MGCRGFAGGADRPIGGDPFARRMRQNGCQGDNAGASLRSTSWTGPSLSLARSAISTYALERIELLLATAERRRDVILQRIYHYRSEMSSVLRRASDRLIEGAVVDSAVVESSVAEAAVESAVVDSAVIESAVAESVVAGPQSPNRGGRDQAPRRQEKSRRRFRSDGTIIRLASAAAKTADHVGDDGGGNTADGGAGAGLPPARKGTAA